MEKAEGGDGAFLAPISGLGKLRSEFERVWPWLWASLCEFGPTHNKEHVWLRLSSRKAFLWTAESAVIVGEFVNWPIGLRDFNYWLQGGKLSGCRILHEGAEKWAAMKGAHRATGYGREGWTRDPGWEKGYTSRYKWLTK